MPATTAKGYPYPLGTDRLNDGDDAIKALAQFTETQAGQGAAGIVSVPVASGAAVGSAAVTFPVGRFSSAPVVQTTINAANTGWLPWGVYNLTTSGCTVQVAHRDGTASGSNTSFNVMWLARN